MASWLSDILGAPPAGRSRRRFTTKFWVILASSICLLLILTAGYHRRADFLPSTTGDVTPSEEGDSASPSPPSSTATDDKNLSSPSPEVELKVWEPPDMDPLVHSVHVSEGIKKKPEYPLDPFPNSPMTIPHQDDKQQRPWLGAVICSAWDLKRRMLIRYSWMKMFKNVPMDQRFVISNPGPQWIEIIQQENRTFGDLIVLDHLQEDDFTANTVKTIEFYRWLVEKSPRKYEFVSKMDTDLWINARGMWDNKILPRLEEKNGTFVSNVEQTIIGQFYYDSYHYTAFPHGAIYTATWDIVELLPKLQDHYHIIAGEDVTMAWLLMKGKQKVTFAVLNTEEKFEYDSWDTTGGTAWARDGSDQSSRAHALAGNDVLAVHQLKSDEDWLKVAECFNEEGTKDMPSDLGGPRDVKPGYPRPFFTDIPEDYWEMDHDGRWMCNGVWKLERGVGKDMKKHDDSTGERASGRA